MIERMAERQRHFLAPRPESKQRASALLNFLATIIEPPGEIAELSLPTLAGVQSVRQQSPTIVQNSPTRCPGPFLRA